MPPDTGNTGGGADKLLTSPGCLIKNQNSGEIVSPERWAWVSRKDQGRGGQPVISAAGRERREDCEVKASLDYTMKGAKKKSTVKS